MSDGWEWVDGDIKPEVSDSSKTGYLIRKRIDDDVNYDWHSVDGYDPESKILTNTAVVTVSPKPLAAEMVSGVENSYVYTGGAIEPAVTVQDGEAALVPDTDYMVTYGANTTVAEGGTITVTGMGNYTGELVIAFSITQADPAYTAPENLSVCVGHTLADVELQDGWAWEDDALSVGAAGSHQFAAVFTPEDTQNYNTVKAQLTLTVGEHTGGTATCTEKAVCTACGEEYGDLVAHTPVTVPGKAATCTESGLTDGEKCSVCGETLQEQETISALGHDFGEWTVTQEPTHSAEGEEQRICSRCGEKETQAIPVLEGLSGGETAGVAVGSTVGTMLLAYGVLALLFKKGIVTGAFFIKIFPFIKP